MFDYVAYVNAQRRMLQQFEYPPDSRIPELVAPLPLRKLNDQKSSLAALLRRTADWLEPARPFTLAAECQQM
jgi:hypothetical protein